MPNTTDSQLNVIEASGLPATQWTHDKLSAVLSMGPSSQGLTSMYYIIKNSIDPFRKAVRLLKQCMKARCKRGNSISRESVLLYFEDVTKRGLVELDKFNGHLDAIEGLIDDHQEKDKLLVRFMRADVIRYRAELCVQISPWYPENSFANVVTDKKEAKLQTSKAALIFADNCIELLNEIGEEVERIKDPELQLYGRTRLAEANAFLQKEVYRNLEQAEATLDSVREDLPEGKDVMSLLTFANARALKRTHNVRSTADGMSRYHVANANHAFL